MITLSYAILNFVVAPRFERLDQSLGDNNVQRLREAIETEFTVIDQTALDWADWDQTYQYIIDRNDSYISSNLSSSVLRDIDINAIWYYDLNGTVVYSLGYDRSTGGKLDFPELDTRAILGTGESSHGVLLTTHGPMLFSTRPILTTQHQGPSRGTVVVGRLLDANGINALSERTAAEVRVWPLNLPIPHGLTDVANRLSAQPSGTVSVVNGERLDSYFLIRDYSGAPALLLGTSVERYAAESGRRAIRVATWCMIAVGLVDLLLIFFLLRHLVLNPLTRFVSHIIRVGKTGQLDTYTSDLGQDQFQGLRVEFNEMIRTLALIREREAEQSHAYQNALEAAKAASAAKSTFLANMSHELRTPLNAIIGFSEMIETEVLGPVGTEAYKAYARDINLSGNHLLSLVNDLLHLSRAEAGAIEIEDSLIDPASLIDECCRMLKREAEASDVTLAVHVAGGALLRADLRLTRQMVLNLVGNAIKFTPRGGRVAMEAGLTADGQVFIQVSDTGIGMTAREIPLALEVFGQVAKDPLLKSRGVGLGLPLTKRLIELHGGTLHITSALGEGTTVRLIFPPSRTIDGATAKVPESAATD